MHVFRGSTASAIVELTTEELGTIQDALDGRPGDDAATLSTQLGELATWQSERAMTRQQTAAVTEIELEAGRKMLTVVIEPWADEFEVKPGARLRLQLSGEAIESLLVEADRDRVTLSPPRYATLLVFSESRELLQEFDMRDVPPVPPGFRI